MFFEFLGDAEDKEGGVVDDNDCAVLVNMIGVGFSTISISSSSVLSSASTLKRSITVASDVFFDNTFPSPLFSVPETMFTALSTTPMDFLLFFGVVSKILVCS